MLVCVNVCNLGIAKAVQKISADRRNTLAHIWFVTCFHMYSTRKEKWNQNNRGNNKTAREKEEVEKMSDTACARVSMFCCEIPVNWSNYIFQDRGLVCVYKEWIVSFSVCVCIHQTLTTHRAREPHPITKRTWMKNWVEAAAAAKAKQNKQQPTSAKSKRGDQWKENWNYCALCIHDIRSWCWCCCWCCYLVMVLMLSAATALLSSLLWYSHCICYTLFFCASSSTTVYVLWSSVNLLLQCGWDHSSSCFDFGVSLWLLLLLSYYKRTPWVHLWSRDP